jgi:hypothetical protein
MKKTLLCVGAALLLGLGACGGDDEPAAEATPSPTPVATTAPPASEAPPASSAPASEEPHAGPTAGKETPQEAAQAFYADWGELDRASASGYATRAAIDEAFGQQRAQAEFMDCLEEADHFVCFYYYEGGGLNIIVRDSDAYGFVVTDVFYIAD